MSFLFVSTISGFGSFFIIVAAAGFASNDVTTDVIELLIGDASVVATGEGCWFTVAATGLPPSRRKRRRRICKSESIF